MKKLLWILSGFIAVTAIVSRFTIITHPDGQVMQLDTAILKNTPFHNFLVPGIVLMVAVGGINLVAVISKISNGINCYLWALAGGIVIIDWIIIQMMFIETIHFMQFIYLLVGVCITAISLSTKTQLQTKS